MADLFNAYFNLEFSNVNNRRKKRTAMVDSVSIQVLRKQFGDSLVNRAILATRKWNNMRPYLCHTWRKADDAMDVFIRFKLPYSFRMFKALTEEGHISKTVDGYVFDTQTPIHVQTMLAAMAKHRLSKQGRPTAKSNPPTVPNRWSANLTHLIVSDKELADELRRRGYILSATKTVEL